MVLQNEFLTNYRIIFVPLIGLAIGVFWFLNKKIFPYLLAIFWKSFGYSILVQGIQLLSVICIMKALSIELQTITYLFIFMIASCFFW